MKTRRKDMKAENAGETPSQSWDSPMTLAGLKTVLHKPLPQQLAPEKGRE